MVPDLSTKFGRYSFSMTIILQFHGNQTVAKATPMNFGPQARQSLPMCQI